MSNNKRKMAGKILTLLVILLLFTKCNRHPKIEITKDYIYNSNWSKKNPASVSVWRIIPNNNIKSKNITNLSSFEIHNNSKIDSSFNYITSPNKNKNVKKYFFNKKNDGIIWQKRFTTKRVDIMGSLELNNWYRFDSYLYKSWIYYVYVDKNGSTHLFPVNPVNI